MLHATIPQSTEMTSGTSKSPCHRVFPQSANETGCYGDGWVPISEGICGRRCFSKALHEWQVEAVTLPMTALAEAPLLHVGQCLQSEWVVMQPQSGVAVMDL
jgi:hypothetical protein